MDAKKNYFYRASNIHQTDMVQIKFFFNNNSFFILYILQFQHYNLKLL